MCPWCQTVSDTVVKLTRCLTPSDTHDAAARGARPLLLLRRRRTARPRRRFADGAARRDRRAARPEWVRQDDAAADAVGHADAGTRPGRARWRAGRRAAAPRSGETHRRRAAGDA